MPKKREYCETEICPSVETELINSNLWYLTKVLNFDQTKNSFLNHLRQMVIFDKTQKKSDDKDELRY